jgi:hypothetical protein
MIRCVVAIRETDSRASKLLCWFAFITRGVLRA